MPVTVPSIVTAFARGGGAMAFTLDIEPSSVDSWTTKRYSTAAVEIAGNAYSEATLGGLAKIGYEAKVIQGGNVATLPAVDVKLINKNKHHEIFITDRIEGRRAVVQMTAIGPNICKNSSFEKRSSDDFENWVEVPGAGGGTVTADTGEYQDGAVSCKLVGGTAGSSIVSDVMTWRVGSKVIVSCYVKTASGTATLKAAVNVATALWYNAVAGTFGLSRVKNTMGTATTTWQRFSIEMDWLDFYNHYSGAGTALLVDQTIYIELWSEASETIYVDAVQVELNNQLTPYYHNRYELVAADACAVFTGVVKNPEWNADEIAITLEAWDSNRHRNIPATILTQDTDASWTVPKDSLGKPFPMTYGDFNSDEHTVWNPDNPDLREFARGLLVNTDSNDPSGVLVHFDKPGMVLYHPAGGVFRLYHFDDNTGRYFEQMYNDDAAYSYDAREFDDDLAANAAFKQAASVRWLPLNKTPLMALLRAVKYEGTKLNWTNELAACDADFGTYAYSNFTAGYCMYKLEEFPFGADAVIKRTTTDADVYFLGYILGTGGSQVDWIAFFLRGADYDPGGFTATQFITAEATPFWWHNIPYKSEVTNKLLTAVKLIITDWNKFKACIPEMCLYFWFDNDASSVTDLVETGALLYFVLDLETTAFAGQLFGRSFGTTWDSRKTAANMVESAPEVIESIIREELGGVDANINETLFDAADTARSIAAAGQLLEVKNSMDVIKDICDEYGLLYFVDIAGKHSLVNLDWRAVTKHLFLHDWFDPFSKVKISYTPRSEITNDIIMHYDKNQFTGDYRKVAYCNKDAASGTVGAGYITKCAASYAELGNIVQAVEFECDWIKHDDTAETMVEWTVDWLYKQRLIITGDLFLDNVDLALGDMVSVDLEPLLPRSLTETARFMVVGLTINRVNSRLQVKLLEVKEP